MPSRVLGVLSGVSRALGSALIGLAASCLLPAGAFAEAFDVTYLPAGVDAANIGTSGAASLCAQTSTCVLGTENFDQPSLTSGVSFSSDFGTNGRIAGTYSGTFQILPADTYGGAGGSGQYINVPNLASYTLALTTSGLPGVNVFGLWISALDEGNTVTFSNQGQTVFSFTPDQLMAALRGCSASLVATNGYCGNPNAPYSSVANSPTHGQTIQDGFRSNQDFNPQPYAYVEFFDPTGFFDTVVLSENAPGNFEADNEMVGYRDPNAPVGTPVPEPASGVLLLGAVLMAAAVTRASGAGQHPGG